MTKAGKVRQQTPFIESTGVNSKKKSIPRKRYKKKYIKRIVKGNYGGQPDSIGARRRSYKK